MDDFAGLASDELTDSADGFLAEFEMPEEAANDLIMQARVAEGWLTQEELEEMRAKAAEEAAAAAEDMTGGDASGEPAFAG
jgi:hypothetical protein